MNIELMTMQILPICQPFQKSSHVLCVQLTVATYLQHCVDLLGSYLGSREHLEKIAREQLGMKNPGEEVVVISKEEEDEFSSERSLEDEEKQTFWNPKYWWEWLKGK